MEDSPLIRADLVAPAQIDGGHLGKVAHQVQGQAGAVLPHGGIAARADVAVQEGDAQPAGSRGLQDPFQVGVPDAEAGRGAADIGAVGVPRAEPGVEADGCLGSGEPLPVERELVEGAGVEPHAHGDQFVEVVGQLLRGEQYVFGGHPGGQARLASHPELASICRPARVSTRSTPAEGQAFMA